MVLGKFANICPNLVPWSPWPEVSLCLCPVLETQNSCVRHKPPQRAVTDVESLHHSGWKRPSRSSKSDHKPEVAKPSTDPELGIARCSPGSFSGAVPGTAITWKTLHRQEQCHVHNPAPQERLQPRQCLLEGPHSRAELIQKVLEYVEDKLHVREEPARRGAGLDLVLPNKQDLVGNEKLKGSLG